MRLARLSQVDLSEKPSFWKALKPPAKDKCGELLCSLCYHPSNSILTLTLLKARNLKAKDINGKSGNDSSYRSCASIDRDSARSPNGIFRCSLSFCFSVSSSFSLRIWNALCRTYVNDPCVPPDRTRAMTRSFLSSRRKIDERQLNVS